MQRRSRGPARTARSAARGTARSTLRGSRSPSTGRPATRPLFRERVRLVPPALDHQVRRWLHLELVRAARKPRLERRQVHLEDVVEALEAALAEQLVLGRPEPGEVEHLRLVAPLEDVV